MVHLATSTNSSASAQIFNAATDTFLLVGSLNTARESTAEVVLPNEQTLIVGGNECSGMTYGGTSGFQCNALATAELYNETTKAFTFAGTGGPMSIARSGPSATLIEGSGTGLDGQVLIVGGSTGSSFLSLTPPPAGSGAPGVETALNTAELYNPATDAFSLTNSIPACPAGHSSPPVAPSTCPAGDVCDCTSGLPSVCGGTTTSAITSAAETGTTATITMTTANPPGLTMGSNVTVANVSVAGYNGTFVVTGIPSGTTFTYTTVTGSLASGTGGTAQADTFECGLVDQGAAQIPNDSGKILLAGGDVVAFLGQSSNLSFIFDPSTHSFSQTTGSMNIPRELFSLNALDPSVVKGSLAGDLVAFGGVRANSAACISPDIVATTLGNAEVYNPSSQTWSLNVGASAPITSTSETTNVVTVTSAANPAGLTVGEGVTISGVTATVTVSAPNNYNGTFVVASIPSSTTFTYTAHNITSAPSNPGSGGTAQAGTMGDTRAAVATLLETGSLAGEVVIPGGVDVEAGTFPATCVTVATLKQRATAEVDLYNPDSGTLGTFSATGSLNQAREGAGQGQIGGASTAATDLLVIGGACTVPSPSLQSVPIGTAQAATTCGSTNAQNDYSELYSQSAKTWSVGPAPAAGFTPTNAPASVVLP